MALTVCFKCDKSYGDRHDACPHCGCHNFFSDEDTMYQAIDHLCDDLNAKAEQEKKAKLQELRWVRFQMKCAEWWEWFADAIDQPSWLVLALYAAIFFLIIWLSGVF